MYQYKLILGILFISCHFFVFSQSKRTEFSMIPVQSDFTPFTKETDVVGSIPKNWYAPDFTKKTGYSFSVTKENQNNIITIVNTKGEYNDYGILLQSFPAKIYHNKRVRFSADIKIEGDEQSFANLYISYSIGDADRITELTNIPKGRKDWTNYKVSTSIPDFAQNVTVGIYFVGKGKVHFDNVDLIMLGQIRDGNIGPFPVYEKEMDNIMAFMRMYGYIRYFHPSDQSIGIDWERFVINGIDYVEKVDKPIELANALEQYFKPIAPLVRVFPTEELGAKFSLPEELLAQNNVNNDVVFWTHYGYSPSQKFAAPTSYRTVKSNPYYKKQGVIGQTIQAKEFAGKKIRITANVKTISSKEKGKAFLWLRQDKQSNVLGTLIEAIDNDKSSNEWSKIVIETALENDINFLSYGCGIQGFAEANFDNIQVEIFDGKVYKVAQIYNADFSKIDATNKPEGWNISTSSSPVKYTIESRKKGNNTYVFFKTQEYTFDVSYDPSQTLVVPIEGNVTCMIPIALYVDSLGRTIPTTSSIDLIESKLEGFTSSHSDKSSRIAIAGMLWNTFKHFYPYQDQELVRWTRSLMNVISGVALTPEEPEMTHVLKRFTAELNDGQSRVWRMPVKQTFSLPFLWDMVGENLIITDVLPDSLLLVSPGDTIAGINGLPMQEYLSLEKNKISSATDQWKTVRALAEIRNGIKDSIVQLQVKPFKQRTKPFSVKMNFVINSRFMLEPRLKPIQKLNGGLLYVDLTRLEEKEMNDLIPTFQQYKGIVFDVRGIPTVTAKFLTSFSSNSIRSPYWLTPVITYPDYLRTEFDTTFFEVAGSKKATKVKTAFLMDSRSIGYAETILSLVESSNLGVIIGSPSAGTNGTSQNVPLPLSYFASFTTTKVLNNNLLPFHGVGVAPSIPISKTINGIVSGNDEYLEAAVKYLFNEVSK
jgi:hypothetical protein